MITYFFQGNEEVLYEMISPEGATPSFSKEVVVDQRTGMIGRATAGDDLEVLVILCSMKSAVSQNIFWYEKCPLPVAVRVLQTRVLKLLNVSFVRSELIPRQHAA